MPSAVHGGPSDQRAQISMSLPSGTTSNVRSPSWPPRLLTSAWTTTRSPLAAVTWMSPWTSMMRSLPPDAICPVQSNGFPGDTRVCAPADVAVSAASAIAMDRRCTASLRRWFPYPYSLMVRGPRGFERLRCGHCKARRVNHRVDLDLVERQLLALGLALGAGVDPPWEAHAIDQLIVAVVGLEDDRVAVVGACTLPFHGQTGCTVHVIEVGVSRVLDGEAQLVSSRAGDGVTADELDDVAARLCVEQRLELGFRRHVLELIARESARAGRRAERVDRPAWRAILAAD